MTRIRPQMVRAERSSALDGSAPSWEQRAVPRLSWRTPPGSAAAQGNKPARYWRGRESPAANERDVCAPQLFQQETARITGGGVQIAGDGR